MSVKTVTQGSLVYETADNIPVAHGFTTRLGGVSQGIWGSMNLSMSRGDRPENVIENYRRLGLCLGFAPEDVVMATQTHSDMVLRVDRSHAGAGLLQPQLPECDALVTDAPGLALFVSTADCTPILLHDPVTGAVGAAHAGWRGTALAIGAKTVAAMVAHFGADPKNIRAAIGPNAAQCHFDTHADVPEAMVAAFGKTVEEYIRPQGEKYYVNLKAINAMILRQAGVENIVLSPSCTMCRPDLFWSHRITRGQRGAQGGIIVCKEARP